RSRHPQLWRKKSSRPSEIYQWQPYNRRFVTNSGPFSQDQIVPERQGIDFTSPSINSPRMNLESALAQSVFGSSSTSTHVFLSFLSIALLGMIGPAAAANGNAAVRRSRAAQGLLLVANKGEQTLGIIDPVAGRQIATV